jgi:hypothetical protein
MEIDTVQLRPIRESDLDFLSDGWLGDEDGKLIVAADDETAGFVGGTPVGHGAGRYRSIGIVLLPEASLHEWQPFPDLHDRDSRGGEVGIAGQDGVDGWPIGDIQDDHSRGVVGQRPGHPDDALTVQLGQVAAVLRTRAETFGRGLQAQFNDPHIGRLRRLRPRRCIC